MKGKKEYYIVEASKLPEIFEKTVQVKRLLQSGQAKTIGEAVEKIGISRSAFYKYKDAVNPFFEAGADRIISFYILLEDTPGVLSRILSLFAKSGANILTINQSIPLNGQAIVTISARTEAIEDLKEMVGEAQVMDGVLKFEMLASGQVIF